MIFILLSRLQQYLSMGSFEASEHWEKIWLEILKF